MDKTELKNRLKQGDHPFKGKPKTEEHKRKIAASWDSKRRKKQAEIASGMNATEGEKLRDYTCPDCGKEFEQVTKNVYGGHRKACRYWQEVQAWFEKEDKESLEEALGEVLDEQ